MQVKEALKETSMMTEALMEDDKEYVPLQMMEVKMSLHPWS